MGDFACVDIAIIPALPGDVHSTLPHVQATCALCRGEAHAREVLLHPIHEPFHIGLARDEVQEETNQPQLLLPRVVIAGWGQEMNLGWSGQTPPTC